MMTQHSHSSVYNTIAKTNKTKHSNIIITTMTNEPMVQIENKSDV